jgi:hypothetical protein
VISPTRLSVALILICTSVGCESITESTATSLQPSFSTYDDDVPVVTQEQADSASPGFGWNNYGSSVRAIDWGQTAPFTSHVGVWSHGTTVAVIFVPSVWHTVMWTDRIDSQNYSDFHTSSPSGYFAGGYAEDEIMTGLQCHVRGNESISAFSRHFGKYGWKIMIQGAPVPLGYDLPEGRSPANGSHTSSCPPVPECPEGQWEDEEGGCIQSDAGEGGGEECTDGWDCEPECVVWTHTRYYWDHTMQRYYAAYTWQTCEEWHH